MSEEQRGDVGNTEGTPMSFEELNKQFSVLKQQNDELLVKNTEKDKLLARQQVFLEQATAQPRIEPEQPTQPATEDANEKLSTMLLNKPVEVLQNFARAITENVKAEVGKTLTHERSVGQFFAQFYNENPKFATKNKRAVVEGYAQQLIQANQNFNPVDVLAHNKEWLLKTSQDFIEGLDKEDEEFNRAEAPVHFGGNAGEPRRQPVKREPKEISREDARSDALQERRKFLAGG